MKVGFTSDLEFVRQPLKFLRHPLEFLCHLGSIGVLRAAELLRAEVVKSHSCAKFSRICAKFRLLRAKLLTQALFLCFWFCSIQSEKGLNFLPVFLYIFLHIFCAKFWIKELWPSTRIIFYKVARKLWVCGQIFQVLHCHHCWIRSTREEEEVQWIADICCCWVHLRWFGDTPYSVAWSKKVKHWLLFCCVFFLMFLKESKIT